MYKSIDPCHIESILTQWKITTAYGRNGKQNPVNWAESQKFLE